MKTPLNRVRQNGNTHALISQVQLAPAESGDVATPQKRQSVLAFEFKKALDELYRAGSVAIALARMNSGRIKQNAEAFAGWEDFNSDTMSTGNAELPRIVEDNFTHELAAWRREILPANGKNRTVKYNWNIENAVGALRALLDLQSNELGLRPQSPVWALANEIEKRLAAAFSAAWEAYGNYRRSWEGDAAPQFA